MQLSQILSTLHKQLSGQIMLLIMHILRVSKIYPLTQISQVKGSLQEEQFDKQFGLHCLLGNRV